MTCHDVEAWMLSVESPNRPSAEVRRHIRSCAACRRAFGRLVRLIHEVSTAPLPPVSPGARDRLLTRIASLPATLPLPEPAAPTRKSLPWKQVVHSPWARYAAAAVLFLALGVGLAFLARSRQGSDGPRPERADRQPEAVEDRVLVHHLVLAETHEPVARLDALNDMAGDVREETIQQAQKGASDDLTLLVWLHARILHEGIQRVARTLPGNPQVLAAPIVAKLEQAERRLKASARDVPKGSALALEQVGRHVHETIVALNGGPAGQPPATTAPVVLASRSLLQVLVLSSLETAIEEDPVKRAAHSTDVAGRLADTLAEQAGKVEPNEASRLAEALQSVMERGVRNNLEDVDLDKVDDVRRKQMEKVQQRAGAAVEKLQPNNPQLQQLPPEVLQNLLRTLELAQQLKQHGHHGKGPPKKRGKGNSGKDRD